MMWLILLLRTLGVEGILSFVIIFQVKKKKPEVLRDKGAHRMIHSIYNWRLQNKGETDQQPRLDAWDKRWDLVLWEDLEGVGGEGRGRGDRDGEDM